ncbi:MAG: insulinase family protein [Terracidiphilus sp.]
MKKLSKRHSSCPVLKGHGFSRAVKRFKWNAALAAEGMQMVEQEASGHDFSRAVKRFKWNAALAAEGMQMVEQEASGHGFSRAVKSPKKTWALAPEGSFSRSNLKFRLFSQHKKAISFVTIVLVGLIGVALVGCNHTAQQSLAPAATPPFIANTAPATQLPVQQAKPSKPWEKIPTPKLHEFKPHQPQRIELKNGIVLFLQEDHELPFVSGSVLIPGGSRDEDQAKTGLVGIYAQAWRTSGTAKLNGDALDDLLESKAAHIETGADVDSTALSWDSLKGDSDQVLSLAMDLLFHPQFNMEKMRLAQQQEATSIVRRNDDEAEIAGRESSKLVYGPDSPYTRQPELATIGAVGLEDLKAWHDRSIGGKLIVSISGDFDPAAMEAKLRAAFEGLPAVKIAPSRHDVFAGPKPGVYFIDKEDVNQSNVQIVGERDSGWQLCQSDVPENSHRDGIGLCRGRQLWLRMGSSGRVPRHGADQERFDGGRDHSRAGGDQRPDHAALYRRRIGAGQGQHSQLLPLPLRHAGEGAGRKSAPRVLRLPGQLP